MSEQAKRVEPYSILARDYDRELGHVFSRFQRPFLDGVIDQLRAIPAVLDLACGSGRVACYLARRGAPSVVGVDRSVPMLRLARRRPYGKRVAWLCGDVRSIPVTRRFPLVCCNFDTVNHLLADADVAMLFAEVRARLEPDGIFVFDVNTRHALVTDWPSLSRVIDAETHSAVWKATVDRRRGRATLLADYFVRRDDGLFEHLQERHVQRAYALDDLCKYLSGEGLSVQRWFTDGRWERPDAAAKRVAFVCRLIRS